MPAAIITLTCGRTYPTGFTPLKMIMEGCKIAQSEFKVHSADEIKGVANNVLGDLRNVAAQQTAALCTKLEHYWSEK
ncbi:hypothetical protein M378DRAFT_168228 [Amanita muscaria Koide BX008]|uniref:Uncharacterized protein n=1 Tax=Amanita muscaria (strain Koide BX008) TaxID=946122 RepID=A0A0C2T1L3_AMAMK|nr:hypothetical protein M378DRAFT_168228 [Amanita muscaria Koide BX008]